MVSGRFKKPEIESPCQRPGKGQDLSSRTVLQPQSKAFTVTNYYLVTLYALIPRQWPFPLSRWAPVTHC